MTAPTASVFGGFTATATLPAVASVIGPATFTGTFGFSDSNIFDGSPIDVTLPSVFFERNDKCIEGLRAIAQDRFLCRTRFALVDSELRSTTFALTDLFDSRIGGTDDVDTSDAIDFKQAWDTSGFGIV